MEEGAGWIGERLPTISSLNDDRLRESDERIELKPCIVVVAMATRCSVVSDSATNSRWISRRLVKITGLLGS